MRVLLAQVVDERRELVVEFEVTYGLHVLDNVPVVVPSGVGREEQDEQLSVRLELCFGVDIANIVAVPLERRE